MIRNEPPGNWLILLPSSSLELVDADILLVVVASVGNWCEIILTDVLRDDSSVDDDRTFVVTVHTVTITNSTITIMFHKPTADPERHLADVVQLHCVSKKTSHLKTLCNFVKS